MAKESNEVIAANRKAMHDLDNQKRTLRNVYAAEDKVPMYLSPMYRPHLGNNMRVSLNGISIFFPVDGSTHLIPTSFADEIVRRRMAVDNIIAKQGRMSDIASNMENAPGELTVF